MHISAVVRGREPALMHISARGGRGDGRTGSAARTAAAPRAQGPQRRTVVRMPARPADAPRSLADDLRARDDAQLLALLRGRPDLTAPVPADITSLAARATTRASVGRALDALDAFTL